MALIEEVLVWFSGVEAAVITACAFIAGSMIGLIIGIFHHDKL